MLTLLIARHGNTFNKGDIVRRVGLRTDLSLSSSGKQQCDELGKQLSAYYPTINHAYCSELQRTRQSVESILTHYPNSHCPISSLKILNEVDYGMDDGKAEHEVVERLGIETLKAWDDKAILPNGWHFNIEQIIGSIHTLADSLIQTHMDETLLLVTSNGIARFFTYLLNNQECINKAKPLKMPTASISELTYTQDNGWQCNYWAKRF